MTTKENKAKNGNLKWLLAFTSVLVVITIGTSIVTFFLPNMKVAESVLHATDTKNTSESTDLDIDLSAVRYCTDSSGKNLGESIPGLGQVNMADSLKHEILKPENKDKYFSVSIEFLYFDCVEKYKEAMEEKYLVTLKDPTILLFQAEYENWVKTVVKPTIPQENMEKFEEKIYQSLPHYKEFEEGYWAQTQSEDTQKAYREAEQRRMKAWNEYSSFSLNEDQILYQKFVKDVEVEINAELDRLNKLGYKLILTDKIAYYQNFDCGRLTGYLTGEQLLSFDCSHKHGYCISWNDHEGVVSE